MLDSEDEQVAPMDSLAELQDEEDLSEVQIAINRLLALCTDSAFPKRLHMLTAAEFAKLEASGTLYLCLYFLTHIW